MSLNKLLLLELVLTSVSSNVEWALITKMKFAAMNARVSYTEVRRAVPPNNAPPDVNQATIADSQQWFGRLPGESATTHP